MFEQSKAAKRRFNDGNFHSKYFRGIGMDIGAGNDTLQNNISSFPGIRRVRGWDMPDGDAQYLETVKDGEYDFVHASHCLEHMVDWKVALENWIRVVRQGGYLIITIPEERMYEKFNWPSKFNSDHKWSFTLQPQSPMPKTVNVLDMCRAINELATVEKIELIDQFYREDVDQQFDQTMTPNVEWCIEVILRRK